MKPSEGRARAIIERITPLVDCGRFPTKQIVGDSVRITAAIYGDGHDHIAAQLFFRQKTKGNWQQVRMRPLGNDLWDAEFPVDLIGAWEYYIEAWIDHFDTWAADLAKRLANQAPASLEDNQRGNQAPLEIDSNVAQNRVDLQLAFRSGAEHLNQCASRANKTDKACLSALAKQLIHLSEASVPYHDNPVTDEMRELAERYPDLRFSTKSQQLPIWVDRERARFSTWYEFFPRSAGPTDAPGTLRDAANLIPEIASRGFDVIYLPPIHPIGKSFRKGKNNSVIAAPGDVGSPWAIGGHDGGHTSIAPELGSLEDFELLIQAAEASQVEIALDIAFQCSPDHPWVSKHPDWFSIRPDGSIQYAENPPKKYQDIYPLNFESKDWQKLWDELRDVFLFWARRGVRIFRVDNPHTKALPFWEWCIQEVRRRYPDVLFLSEAFTRPHVMYGLAKRGFSQSYTYFSWRNSKEELTSYLTEITSPPVSDFFRPNLWPNTPDILPGLLQKGGRAAFIQRVILAATLGSSYGIYGPAFELMEHIPVREGSEEYLDSEKYQIRSWDRARSDSLMPLIERLNHIRQAHPSLQRNDTLRFHAIDNPELICYSKRFRQDVVLVVVNLDTLNSQSGWTDLNLNDLGVETSQSYEVHDLLNDATYSWTGAHNYVLLDPGTMPAHVLHLRIQDQKNEAML